MNTFKSFHCNLNSWSQASNMASMMVPPEADAFPFIFLFSRITTSPFMLLLKLQNTLAVDMHCMLLQKD